MTEQVQNETGKGAMPDVCLTPVLSPAGPNTDTDALSQYGAVTDGTAAVLQYEAFHLHDAITYLSDNHTTE